MSDVGSSPSPSFVAHNATAPSSSTLDVENPVIDENDMSPSSSSRQAPPFEEVNVYTLTQTLSFKGIDASNVTAPQKLEIQQGLATMFSVDMNAVAIKRIYSVPSAPNTGRQLLLRRMLTNFSSGGMSSRSSSSSSLSTNNTFIPEIETQIEYEIRTEDASTLQAMEIKMNQIATSEADLLQSVVNIVASSLDVNPAYLIVLSASSPKQLPVSIVLRLPEQNSELSTPSPRRESDTDIGVNISVNESNTLLTPSGDDVPNLSTPSPRRESDTVIGVNISMNESNALHTPSGNHVPGMDMATVIATVTTSSVLFCVVVVVTVCFKRRLKKRRSKVTPASHDSVIAPRQLAVSPPPNGEDATVVSSNLSKKLVLLKHIRDAKLALLDVTNPERKTELEATIQDNMRRLEVLNADERNSNTAGSGSATSGASPTARGLRRPGQASMASFRKPNGEVSPISGGLRRPGNRSMASFAVRSHMNDEARLRHAIEEGAAAQHNRVMQRLRKRRQSAVAVKPKTHLPPHSPPPPSGKGGASKLTHRGKGNLLTNKHTAADLSKPLDFASILKRGKTIRAGPSLFKTEADLDLDGDGVIDDNEREIAAVAKASQESDEKFAQKLESQRQESINRLKNRLQRRRRSSLAKMEEHRQASGVLEERGGTGLGISADQLAALRAGSGAVELAAGAAPTASAVPAAISVARGSATPAENFTFE
jgi:hypothetical protein